MNDSNKARYIPKKDRDKTKVKNSVPQVTLTAQMPEQPPKKHGAAWWIGMVLLWICFLPIMATIYVVKNKNLKTPAKVGIIAAIWILCIAITTATPKNSAPTNANDSGSSITQSSSSSSDNGETSQSSSSSATKQSGLIKKGDRGQSYLANFNQQNPDMQIDESQVNKWRSGAGDAYTITAEPFVVELSISDGEDTITCYSNQDINDENLAQFFGFAKKAFAAEGVELTDENIAKLLNGERPYYTHADSSDGKRGFLFMEKTSKADKYNLELFTCRSYY